MTLQMRRPPAVVGFAKYWKIWILDRTPFSFGSRFNVWPFSSLYLLKISENLWFSHFLLGCWNGILALTAKKKMSNGEKRRYHISYHRLEMKDSILKELQGADISFSVR